MTVDTPLSNGHPPDVNAKSKSLESDGTTEQEPILTPVIAKQVKVQPKEEPTVERTSLWNYLLFLLILTVLPIYLSKLHYKLPERLEPYDANGNPQPSEQLILGHIESLETIGYRTVGTSEAVKGEEYVLGEVRKIVSRCEEGEALNCEWWVQQGSGFHSFDILDHEVLKAYNGITNIILKISAKYPPSYNETAKRPEKDAILLGAHMDSTLPSPGAADDGMGVGVMLDLARVVVERNRPFDGSLIFSKSALETLQDGSHLYSTQHPTRHQVRAMINLEAAGSTGGALLFQATSKEMIEAYSHSPHPRGTVIAADVFSSGIIMSDTDFVQFEKYLGVSGLDMATVGHSYFYHTKKDSIKYIEPGSAQHFANNMIAILDHLTSPESPLLQVEEFSPPDMVYFSLLDLIFVHWPVDAAKSVYTSLAVIAGALSVRQLSKKRWKAFLVALIGTPLGLVGGALSANFLAAVLVLAGKGQLWFRHEHLPLLVYLPAGFIGHFSVQLLLSKLLSPVDRTKLESAHYTCQTLFAITLMMVLQSLKVRSAYLFSLLAALLLAGGLLDESTRLIGARNVEGMKIKTTYLIPLVGCTTLAVEAVTTTLDIFTPLAGRMGKDAPAESIIATIASVSGFIFFPTFIPLFHRAPRSSQRKVVLGVLLFLAGVLTALAGPWYWPYDDMHPKRVGVQYLYNHTSGEHTGHIAFMDRGPTSNIVDSIHTRFGKNGSEVINTQLTDYDSDWDTVYPISSFLDTYKFPLEVSREDEQFEWPSMGFYTQEVSWEYATRVLKLRFVFKGLVWPTLAFEASVLRWSFDLPPPIPKMRHHIKVATSVDEHVQDLNLTLRMDVGEKLQIHWTAIDLNQMVPGTASRLGPEMPASKWLTSIDQWAEKEYEGSLEIMMNGVVCGVIEV
ncbi:hypothetical protein L486_00497 [Kwoniella mangroviensis CBS 10435]|uniref:Peptide hydrolase n=1 Tax=Kwoniella mangroviensis CBS 10435 TaxID=1331196 RepID=A0A1B9IZL6_9TREE|nr:hypothetical protein L486_00497 [Kwoniella mangroviensis CBS 10435]